MIDVLNILAWLLSQLLGFIIGIATTITLQVIYYLLPIDPQLRFRISYGLRHLQKWLRNEKIEIKYTLKALIAKEVPADEDALSDKIWQRLMLSGFEVVDKRRGALEFACRVPGAQIGVRIDFGYEETEEETQRVSTIEVVFSATCGYRSFEADMIDLLHVVRRLENALRNIIHPWHSEAISCTLRHLYRFTGVLSSFRMTHLYGEIEGKYKVDLFEGGIIVYAPLSSEIVGILKRIITFYY